MLNRPLKDEYHSFYETYIGKIGEGDIRDLLREGGDNTQALIAGLNEEQGNYRYAENKWSIKELLGHMGDTERILSYRLLWIARNGSAELPGFDEDAFVAASSFAEIPLAQLASNLAVVRQSTFTLLDTISEEAFIRLGIANGSQTSARALAYIIAGHEKHHMNIIQQRYLTQLI
ncbi:hypothetical protein SY83_19780 [Paenibacillus swuensis]|uniref:DinB-like domain-containing protein n=1 Tax=Paenibacillus swuensis TaxID=1178515 RepID=A0A172TMA3_9BACL|nr:DinB family protein [Paenibacillus swuensis]ANE48158.1 hypothetical protein SY83_19780 [Paenibacillus swuensis]